MRNRFGRIVAWGVTAGLLAFLFSRIEVARALDSVRQAPMWALGATVVALLAIYLGDSVAIWKTFSWFAARLTLRDVIIVRGASYLLAALNYSLGQGAVVYFVHRSHGIPVLRGVATVLLIMGANVLVLLMLATGGLVFSAKAPPGLPLIVALAYLALGVYTVLVVARPSWMVRKKAFDVLFSAGVVGHLKAVIVRLPHVAALLVYNLLVLRAFGVIVPIGHALLTLPVVFFISVLPISVQGIGTTEAALVWFFADYAPGGAASVREAVIVGCSLFFARPIALAFQMVVGFTCLRTEVGRAFMHVGPSPGGIFAPRDDSRRV